MHNSSIVKLQSNDGQVFEVAYGTIKQSQTMEALLEEFDYPEDVIPIPNINSATLAKIVEWCEHHKNDPAYVEEEVDPLRRHTSIEVPEWDRNFFNVSQEMLSDILNAAHYLSITPLVQIGCKMVANLIKGKSTEQLRELFGMEDDFTEEQKQALREEYPWANVDDN